jgi:hypothetical protein
MPKREIDYSKTIIYRIICKDVKVKDSYIGYTTNFSQKKYAHKKNYMDENNCNHNCILYETIRKNGGWENWKFEIIVTEKCEDQNEAKKIEQIYINSLGATLNETLDINLKNNEKTTKKYVCKNCNLITGNKKDYITHINSQKHIKNTVSLTNFPQFSPISPISPRCIKSSKNQKHICNGCNKQYCSRVGLWYHMKKCDNNPMMVSSQEKNSSENQQTQIVDTNLVIELLKQNQELQKTILELSKERTVNINCKNNNSNSHNKTFNLQVFLNEECKDALNINEFVEQIKIQLTDLETTGRLGYVEGVTRIINKNLNELETNKRPIHCSDIKRETIYIKDENEWIKENNDKSILKNAVKEIANKNILQIKEWKKANPDCMDSDSKKNDLYLKIVSNSMSGSTKEEQINNLNKIISKVTKEAVIDKAEK